MTRPRSVSVHRPVGHLLATLLGAVLLGVALLAGSTGAADAGAGREPAPDTIVAVDGDKAHGFTIHFYDGSALFPPTASEARAECREPVTRVARVRCRTEVRVWYRDLGDLKQALAHAHS